MSEQEFLEKYGSEKVFFSYLDKLRAVYRNDELGIVCSGTLEYRDYLVYEETVMEIFQLDFFEFNVNQK